MEALKPIYELTIAGKNITEDVSPFVSSVEYIDRLEDGSDEVSLVFDDIAGLWHSDWYPQQGDKLTLKIGYAGAMMDCGLFEIDEIELRGAPDTLTVKALASAVMSEMRTQNSVAYENQTMRQIAQNIATKHGLRLTGDTSKLQDITVDRRTQNDETDLSFLANLAKEFGFIFSSRGDQLVFLNPEELENRDPVLLFHRENVSNYSFRDRTSETFQSAEISRRDVRTNQVQKWRIETSGNTTKKDTLIVGGRVENSSQAEAKAKGAMRCANKDKLTGNFTTDGIPLLVSGVNIELYGFGSFSGKWTVKESSHKISVDSGYTTAVSIRKGPYPRTVQPAQSTASATETEVNWAKIIGLM